MTLPKDFRCYLLISCPDAKFLDQEDTEWWSLDRVKSIPEEHQHQIRRPGVFSCAGQYLFFADHTSWCWAWAIACTDGENRGKVAIIGGGPDRFAADGLPGFVDLYMNDHQFAS